jgi:hypothetical protein
MTEEDLWKRVAQGASAKPYKALALDLTTKARRRHDEAVEAGLSVHYRIEIAQARPDASGQMKAAFEAGRAREAFAKRRVALETLLETALERMKQAAALISERTKSLAATVRTTQDSSEYSTEPKSMRRPVVSHRGPSF